MGRASELQVLADAMGELAGGHGRVIILSGEAGIGKTTLLRHAGELGRAAGVHVLRANASALEREFAFGVARQLLPELDGAMLKTSTEAPFEAIQALFARIGEIAEAGPVLLAVDDLQWVDAASLRFLNYVATRIGTLAVTVLAGQRLDGTTSEPLVAELTARARQVWVAPLEAADVAELAGKVFDDEVDDGFARACHAASGGNPFLVNEALAVLREQGVRPTGDGIPYLATVTSRAVVDRTASRLRTVSGALELTQALTVTGDHGRLELAVEVAGLGMEQAMSALDALLRGRVVKYEQDGVVFVHSIVASAVAATLNPLRARAWHAKAAELCHRHFLKLERIAAHLLQAGPPREGWQVDVLGEAAESAHRMGAFESAATLLRHALSAPRLSDDLRLRLRGRLGAALVFDDASASREILAELLPLTSGDLYAQVASDLLLATLNTEGFIAGTKLVGNVIDEVAGHDLAAAMPLIARSMGTGWLSDSPVRALLDQVEAVAGSHPHGRAIVAAARAQLAGEIMSDADADAAAAQATHALELFWGSGEPEAADMSVHLGAVQGLLVAERFEEALAWAARAEQLAARRGWPKVLRGAAWVRYACALLTGHTDAALSAARDFEASGVALGSGKPLPYSNGYVAGALLAAGRLDEAEAALGALALGELRAADQFIAAVTRAALRLAQHRWEEALADALMCGRLLPKTVANPLIAPWRPIGALAAHRMGDPAQAHRLADAELRPARRWGAPHTLGLALSTAGIVHGDLALVREAVDVTRGTPARAALMWALLALDEPDALTESLRIAEQNGWGSVVPAVREALRAHGRRPGTRPVTALTRGERAVADLAARGLTNAGICDRLHLAPRTVEQHLTRTYRKLGIAGRAELVPAMRADGWRS
ncbi:ATP-binding protein [Streptomyces sp. NPDC093097]|uniref:ATP-binding protein n=1 Tax=Streptomyces sp. NPDC093097 TaxID=3366027 RepID=UPI003820056F